MMTLESMARYAKRTLGRGLGGLWVVVALTAAAAAQEKATPPPGDDAPAVVKDFEAGQKSKGGAKAKAPAEAKAKAQKETVRLSFTTSPGAKARVYYGRKLLGTTPFSVQWPRNSGPVDVVVRAHGYLTVNTRAYTFRDDDVSVRLTRPGSAQKLVGYKAPVEPEPEEGEQPSSMPATPTPTPATPTPATP